MQKVFYVLPVGNDIECWDYRVMSFECGVTRYFYFAGLWFTFHISAKLNPSEAMAKINAKMQTFE